MAKEKRPKHVVEIARDLESYISLNALAGRELKSVARSIGYELSMFKPAKKRALLTGLVLVNAFMGSEVLRFFTDRLRAEPKVDIDVGGVAEEYANRLMSRWLTEREQAACRSQMDELGSLAFGDEDTDIYDQALDRTVVSFYRALTGEEPQVDVVLSLRLRFNGYAARYMESVKNLLKHHFE